MEKFSKFRDRGSGVAPFIPISTPSTTLSSIPHLFLFLLRLLPLIVYAAVYFLCLHNLPLPTAVRKLLLWGMMSIPGIWWVDLQIDGVKRGHLSQQPASRVPQPGSVIASSFTSPIDALYLAAIFDPIFTLSYPGTRKVRRVSLFRSIVQALSHSQLALSPHETALETYTDVHALLVANPGRVIVVFPECGTTNGKGVLPYSPSLLSVPSTAKIFPVSIRYTPSDITTPIPGAWFTFLWKLLSRPTHCIRVRIAEGIVNASAREGNNTNTLGDIVGKPFNESAGSWKESKDSQTPDEQMLLSRVAETQARLGRNTRVGLTLRDKAEFLEAWNKPKTS